MKNTYVCIGISIYLCYFENCDDDVNQLNTTITHNAPLEECLDIFELGCPVFMSGEVYNLKNGNYTKETNTIDCIPSVKSTGTYKEFLGIVVNKHKSGDKVKIGDVMKKDESAVCRRFPQRSACLKRSPS